LSEVADEIRVIAFEQDRWLKIASALIHGTTASRSRGIRGSKDEIRCGEDA
jgi:hypothetical protein